MLRKVGWVLLVIGMLLGRRESVFACSGGSWYSFDGMINDASLIVKARVLDTDRFGQTGMVEVIEYFRGSSPSNKLLVVQLEPVAVRFLISDPATPGCSVLAEPFLLNEEVYLFLNHNPNGYYSPTIRPISLINHLVAIRFPNPETRFTINFEEPLGQYQYEDVDEAGFREALTTRLVRDPIVTMTLEDSNPMPAPVLITTHSGLHYLIPVDYGPPRLIPSHQLPALRRSPSLWRRGNPLGVTGCNTIGCVAYSPDGLRQATLTQDGIVINVIYFAREDAFYPYETIPGEAFLFSPFSGDLLVWQQDNLVFYRYDVNFHLRSPDAQHYLHPTQGSARWAGLGAWSANGGLVAYTDQAGLWLLDVYAQFARLIIPAEADRPLAIARYFSPAGRYLAITEGDHRSHFDLITQARLPDGVFSPDDRHLVRFDTAAPISAMSLCLTPSATNCVEEGRLGREAIWTSANTYLVSGCPEITALTCFYSSRSVARVSNRFSGAIRLWPGLAADYEPVTQTYLVLSDENRLHMITPGRFFWQHDLRLSIDEPIIAAEWLPALYSGERTFSPIVIARYQAWLDSLPD